MIDEETIWNVLMRNNRFGFWAERGTGQYWDACVWRTFAAWSPDAMSFDEGWWNAL